MLSNKSLKEISLIFCGDTKGYYNYKTGPQLVNFFNSYFDANDRYYQGFETRWKYVNTKLIEFINAGKFDLFLNHILAISYIMEDCNLLQIDAIERTNTILEKFNTIVQEDSYKIIYFDGKYHLLSEEEDMILIGKGGFANVYKQKSTHLVVKKLNNDSLNDKSIRSRFKREFSITKSLQDLDGIIKVYDFNESTYSYTMELAEQTLEQYIKKATPNDQIRIKYIKEILHIMKTVHEKDIIHRDLSPNNIFIIQGKIKIADFGLGKDLSAFTSHQTVNTRSLGQYPYCAPEQFTYLRDGNKRSDIFSLGKIINYIMTESPTNTSHIFRTVAEKASHNNPEHRYIDVSQLLTDVLKTVDFHENKHNEDIVLEKVAKNIFDIDVENYIYKLSPEKVCSLLLKKQLGIRDALLQFMKCDEEHALHIIKNVESTYQYECGNVFAAYDTFSSFAYHILKEDYSYSVKEIAATILNYVAVDINRFSAQNMIEQLKKNGMEPLLLDILDQ